MKVAVYGLWHLGSVTAACLAEAGFETIGIDPDASVVEGLSLGRAPLAEPGLDDLVAQGVAQGRLSFSDNAASASDAGLVWVTFDTPVDDEDRANVEYVENRVRELFPHLPPGSVVLISSQVPVGTTAGLARDFKTETGRNDVAFACSPENLRLGRAIQAFHEAARIVGTEDGVPHPALAELLAGIGGDVVWMNLESAEMVKHALNTYLALSITYANEIASVCERVGADAMQVTAGLRKDPRVGQAPVRPGAAFAGGTLARDVTFLRDIADRRDVPISLIPEILASNKRHSMWALRQLEQRLDGVAGRTIAVFGLAYTPGTSTLRRSATYELAQQAAQLGANVRAFDVLVRDAGDLALCSSVKEALALADAVVIGAVKPEEYPLDAESLASMQRQLIVDQNGLYPQLAGSNAEYVTFGKPS